MSGPHRLRRETCSQCPTIAGGDGQAGHHMAHRQSGRQRVRGTWHPRAEEAEGIHRELEEDRRQSDTSGETKSSRGVDNDHFRCYRRPWGESRQLAPAPSSSARAQSVSDRLGRFCKAVMRCARTTCRVFRQAEASDWTRVGRSRQSTAVAASRRLALDLQCVSGPPLRRAPPQWDAVPRGLLANRCQV